MQNKQKKKKRKKEMNHLEPKSKQGIGIGTVIAQIQTVPNPSSHTV